MGTATILDVLGADGFRLQKVATTNGGEYAGACPFCGGTDRFRVWPEEGETGRYWCRGCDKKGDVIEYLKEYRKMPYGEACQVLDGGGGSHPQVKPATPQHPPENGQNSFEYRAGTVAGTDATPETVLHLTLEELASAKKLPVSFLQGLGITDFKYKGSPAVRIPYRDEEGREVAIRFRRCLAKGKPDMRFVWRKGDKVLLYGLERLSDIKTVGWCLIVEGESDCWTMWHHGLPAIGIPGKGTWRSEFAQYLNGIDCYLWQEPDALELPGKVAKGKPDLRVITADDGIKDISEAHCKALDIRQYIAQRKAAARAFSEMEAETRQSDLAELKAKAASILASKVDIIEVVQDAIRAQGYGGDLTAPTIAYLAATSRVLQMRPGAMPVHLLLIGPASCGKSYTWGVAKRLLPPEAYHEIDAGSPRVLIYDDADLSHRVLMFGEADSLPAGEDNPAASAVRGLLQDHYLHYQATIKDKESGAFTVRDINKPGPTVLITTSTRPLGHQLSTRLFTLDVPADMNQIRAALRSQAALEESEPTAANDALIAYQSLLQLQTPWNVSIPFVRGLAEAVAKMPSAPRITRDFARLVALIKTMAVIRYTSRKKDDRGRLIADIVDYETVYRLIGPMYAASLTGASAELRVVVEAVKTLSGRAGGTAVSVTQVAKHLDKNKGNVSRLVKQAVRNEWLVNQENRRGAPFKLVPGEPLPEEAGLPKPETVASYQPATPVQHPFEADFEAGQGGCCGVAPVTGGNAPLPPIARRQVVEV